jgi:DNA-3-methyladenine glycosylase II
MNLKEAMSLPENLSARYDEAVVFLHNLDKDWARTIDLIGPCLHDPKAGRSQRPLSSLATVRP